MERSDTTKLNYEAANLISEAKVYLINKNFLYGMIAAQLQFEESESTPTMAVSPTLVLFYNPDFIKKYNVRQLAAILEHEVWHLVAKHTTRFIFEPSDPNFVLANLACDLAINQYIQDLPETVAQVKQFFYTDENGEQQPFPEGENAETYFHLLKKQAQSLMCSYECRNCPAAKGDGSGNVFQCPRSIDDHSNWGKPDSQGNTFDSEEFKAKMKSIIKNAMDIAKKAAGNIPQDVQEYLEDWFRPPRVPWQQILRKRVAQGTLPSTDLKLSRYRESKRFPGMPGAVKFREAKDIIFSVDCSGSMPSEVLKEAFSLMKVLYQKGYKVTVIQWDTTMTDPEPFKPTLKIEIKKRGGTDPVPVFDYVSKLRNYYHVMFTDGVFFNWPEECPDMNKNFIVFTYKPGYEAWISRYGKRGTLLVELERYA